MNTDTVIWAVRLIVLGIVCLASVLSVVLLPIGKRLKGSRRALFVMIVGGLALLVFVAAAVFLVISFTGWPWVNA